MSSVDQNITLFLRFNNWIKKISVSPSCISDVHTSVVEQFRSEIADSLFELYLDDKDLGVPCDLKRLDQLHDNAIIEIRSKVAALSSDRDQAQEFDLDRLTDEIINELNVPNVEPVYSHSVSTDASLLLTAEWPFSSSNTTQQVNEGDSPQVDIQRRPATHFYVLLTGVPYAADRQDIINFFHPLSIYDEESTCIFFVTNRVGQKIGRVFVVFESQQDYEAAFQRNGHYIGDRRIRTLRGHIGEFNKNVRIAAGIRIKDFADHGSKRGHIVMKLKGFSFDIDEYHIQQWLYNTKAVSPLHVHVIYDHLNRNSGVVYIECRTQQEANRVFQLNNEYLASRYINVFMSSLQHLRLHLAESMGCALPHNFNPYLNCIRVDGISQVCMESDVARFFDESLGITPKHVFARADLGIAFVEFATNSGSQLALTRNQSMLTTSELAQSRVTVMQVSKYEFNMCIGKENMPQLQLEGAGDVTHRCDDMNQMVSIRGIPYECTRAGVLNFLSAFNDGLNRGSLRLLADYRGRFNGKATVVFDNRRMAQQAVQQLDRKYIGSRYVLLALCK